MLGTVFIARAMIAQLVRADRERAALDSGLIQSSKMAALGKLAAGIAHEVNNPLAVIKEKAGWIRDLLSEEDIANSQNLKEFEDSVKKIEHHVERAKKVTHRLLGFARRMEPIDETVDVNRVVQETMGFLEHEARYRNIEIRTELLEDLPQTSSDSAQLQQVFLNILENAIDAAGKDGKIVVRTNYSPRDREITVNISDNGPGIRKEMLGRISIHSSPPNPPGKERGWGFPSATASSRSWGGKSRCPAMRGRGLRSPCTCPSDNRGGGGWRMRGEVPREATRWISSKCSWSTTRRISSRPSSIGCEGETLQRRESTAG